MKRADNRRFKRRGCGSNFLPRDFEVFRCGGVLENKSTLLGGGTFFILEGHSASSPNKSGEERLRADVVRGVWKQGTNWVFLGGGE